MTQIFYRPTLQTDTLIVFKGMKLFTGAGTLRSASNGYVSASASDTVGLAANLAAKSDTSDLLIDATSAQQFNYVKGDTLKSRSAYSAPCWTLHSSVLASDSTTFKQVWFVTTEDSLAIDSVKAVLIGAATDTVSLRVLWGVSAAAMTDSCADIKCFSLTTGIVASSTKVIPPYNFVLVKVTEKDGAPLGATITLNGRRTWAQ